MYIELLLLILLFIVIIYKIIQSKANKIIHLQIGNYIVKVEIVDNIESKTLGLMYRNNLPENNGMLFVFNEPIKVYFWNKNTPLALDIAFIDREGIILEILKLNPFDETIIQSISNKVYYALELNQGWFAKHNITAGMKIYQK
jgi:uncharacterized membrane protein (UPF0127 family)